MYPSTQQIVSSIPITSMSLKRNVIISPNNRKAVVSIPLCTAYLPYSIITIQSQRKPRFLILFNAQRLENGIFGAAIKNDVETADQIRWNRAEVHSRGHGK